jgi:elongation factor 1-gamma
MKLYSPSNNFKLDKVVFASRILGKKVEHIEVPYDHKHKQFIAQYPNFSLPALNAKEAEYVFGADSIVLALFEEKLSAMDGFEKAEVYQWLEVGEREVENSTGVIVVNKEKIGELTEDKVTKAKENVLKAMKTVDDRLKLRTYLVGHSISPADIALFFNFRVVKE